VCTHSAYQMTCDDFEDLFVRSGGRCEICGVSRANLSKPLCIDHDPRRGRWAVRGLLCCWCNTNLGSGYASLGWAEVYLANAWVDERYGSLVTQRPEPEIGSSVWACLPRRSWRRNKRGWLSQDLYSGPGQYTTVTWDNLNRRYGPHRLGRPLVEMPPRPASGPTTLPSNYWSGSEIEGYVRKLAREAGIPPLRDPRGGAIPAPKKATKRRNP
jgi:hypothetical protein